MSDALSSAVSKLRASSARLNQLTDEAAATVKEVEEFLGQECSIGISTSLQVQKAAEPGDDDVYLEYRRIGSRFRIAYVRCPYDGTQTEHVKPWSDCSRNVKLQIIKKLPDLLAAIAKKVDDRIEEAEKTMESVSQVLQSLTGKED